MRVFKMGERVRIGEGGTGRVVAIVKGSLYRIRYDHRDPAGNTHGAYLGHVLRPHRGKSRGW